MDHFDSLFDDLLDKLSIMPSRIEALSEWGNFEEYELGVPIIETFEETFEQILE